MSEAPRWEDILPEPFVTLILGSRGAGKTALAHLLTERFHGEDRDAYILGFPEEKADILPEWLEVLGIEEVLGADDVIEVWPEDSVVLVHEAHHLLHARRSMDTENLEVDVLLTVSRHKNSDIIFETQQSQRLDKNTVTSVDAVIFREPALMQAEFERSGMRKLVRNADEVFEQYVEEIESENYTYREKTDEVKKHAYVHAERFEGEYPYLIPLADHYSEDISKAYAGAGMATSADGDDDGLSDDEEVALQTVADYEMENRPFEYSVKGADHDEVPAQHAWNQLKSLRAEGLIRRVYESSNKPARYRMTDAGWVELGVDTEELPPLGEDPDEND
jgi:AAA+ ATPase superfamily predicted ATPase